MVGRRSAVIDTAIRNIHTESRHGTKVESVGHKVSKIIPGSWRQTSSEDPILTFIEFDRGWSGLD